MSQVGVHNLRFEIIWEEDGTKRITPFITQFTTTIILFDS